MIVQAKRLPIFGALGLLALMPMTLPATAAEALLLEAAQDGTTGATPFYGTVEWSKGVDSAGQPTLVAKATVPGRSLGISVVIGRNNDRTVPASDIMEITFTTPVNSPGGTIDGLPGVLMKNEELVQGVALAGASARIVPNAFLFALANSPADIAANTDLLTTRSFMDLAIMYSSGKRAIVTLNEDHQTQMLFGQVLAAWSRVDTTAAAPAPEPPPVTPTVPSGTAPPATKTVKTMTLRADGTIDTAAPAAPSDTVAPTPYLEAVDEAYTAYNQGEYARALALWLPLAKNGDGHAENGIGDLYHEGHGVKQSDSEAFRWYYMAAKQRVPEAQFSLGILYASGHGVRRDPVRAYMWLALSAAGGFDPAVAERDRAAALLTTAQIDQAAKIGARWDPNAKKRP